LRFPDAGKAQMEAIRRRLAPSQSRGRSLRLIAVPPNEHVRIEEELHASQPSQNSSGSCASIGAEDNR
jgi:hypothetical protein